MHENTADEHFALQAIRIGCDQSTVKSIHCKYRTKESRSCRACPLSPLMYSLLTHCREINWLCLPMPRLSVPSKCSPSPGKPISPKPHSSFLAPSKRRKRRVTAYAFLLSTKNS